MTEREVRSYLDNGLEYDEATNKRVIKELQNKRSFETQREVKSYLDDELEYD